MTADNLLELTRLFYQLEVEAELRGTKCKVTIQFRDGERSDLEIVSTTHLILEANVWAIPLLPDGTASSDGGIQFWLEDVQELTNYDSKHCIFRADTRLHS